MWSEIKSPSDFQDLFNRFDDFHDAILREMYYATPSYLDKKGALVGKPGSVYLRMFFQGGREDARSIDLVALKPDQLVMSQPGWSPYEPIEEAAYFFQDGRIFWSSDKSWHPNDSSQQNSFWFACERLFWKPIENGLGPLLRLRNHEDYDAELEAIFCGKVQ